MKINSELKSNKKKNRNRKRSKKRRGMRKKFNLHKSHFINSDRTVLHLNRMNGDSFWKNYRNVMDWRRNHMDFINSCYLTRKIFVSDVDPSWRPTSAADTPDFTMRKVEGFVVESDRDSIYDEDEEEEEELEVTDEMMDFLEQSMKHKEAMRLKKAEAEITSNVLEEVPEKVLGRDDIEECQTPKEKMIDEKRNLEMSRLYGKSSPMIMGMETALQLTFNKNCDTYKPAFWPCLPLNMQFSNK